MASKAKVLIVEDDPLISMGLRETLTAAGLEVTGLAVSAEDALVSAQVNRPDLAIFVERCSSPPETLACIRLKLGDNWDAGRHPVGVDPVSGQLGRGVLKPKLGLKWLDRQPSVGVRGSRL